MREARGPLVRACREAPIQVGSGRHSGHPTVGREGGSQSDMLIRRSHRPPLMHASTTSDRDTSA